MKPTLAKTEKMFHAKSQQDYAVIHREITLWIITAAWIYDHVLAADELHKKYK